MERQASILCRLLRNPSVNNLMKVRSGAKLVRNEPTMRQQYTRGGAIIGTMYLAVQQNEEQPRRAQLRNKTGHPDRRHRTMNS
eukprot:12973673-Alexandrium_andersonii.AAC.1